MSRLATTGLALFALALGIVLPSTAQANKIAAYPSPGVRVASNETTISFVGVKPSRLGPITVRGSRSGIVRGRFRAHPGGNGVSFIPNRDFQMQERVVVTSKRHRFHGTNRRTYSFATGLLRPKGWRKEPQVPKRGTTPPQWTTYKTFPLKVPKITMHVNQPGASEDEVFLAPKTNGPMIVDKDGELVYYRPGLRTTDFRVQRYMGKPVLTWWRRAQVGEHVESNYAIANSHYKVIRRLTAGNGYTSDPHEFTMTNHNTAYVAGFRTVVLDLRRYGGLRRTPVMDAVAQEIDVKTGLVLWEWHSVGNVKVNETYMPIPRKKITRPFDYFHLNSIAMDRDGNMLLSARHTRALYKVNRKTGKVMWRMGGKRSDFKLGKGMNFAYQHDLRLGPGRTYTLFDNGSAGGPLRDISPRSKGLIFRANPKTGKATLVRSFERSEPLRASSQGNMQLLGNGNFFVGWGSKRYCTEFAPGGEILWDLEYSSQNVSYRCYRSPWTGAPTSPIAVKSEPEDAGSRIWVSWNGDTQVTTWRVLGGGDSGPLGMVGEYPRDGFETTMAVPSGLTRFRLVGLNAKGQVLGRSRINRLGQLTR